MTFLQHCLRLVQFLKGKNGGGMGNHEALSFYSLKREKYKYLTSTCESYLINSLPVLSGYVSLQQEYQLNKKGN